jgi:hypothetical protein
MGSRLTTRHYSSRQSAGGWPLSGANLPQPHWSKIGAGPVRYVLRCVGVVNPLAFHSSLAGSVVVTSDCRRPVPVPAVRICDRRRPRGLPVTIEGTSFDMAIALDSILQSRSAKSSTVSTDGLRMLNFRRKFFLQKAPAVLFDTARLSGLYPFATARVHHCRSVPRRNPAWPR